MILVDILALIGVAFVLLSAAMAPSLESLLWWAAWDRPGAAYPAPVFPKPQPLQEWGAPSNAEPESYAVYLSGAGTMDPARMDT